VSNARDLLAEIRDLLARMSTVSEAPAANLHRGRTTGGKPTSSRPQGPRAGLYDVWLCRFIGEWPCDLCGAAPGERCPVEGVPHHRARAAAYLAGHPGPEPRRLDVLLELGRGELARAQGRTPNPSDGLLDDRSGGPRLENAWERDARIVEWYPNVTPEVAAARECYMGAHATPANIRAVRKHNDLDPETGLEVTPSDRAVALVVELHSRGESQRKIAMELGVSQSTVGRRLAAVGLGSRAA
jgi:hypothetical protein